MFASKITNESQHHSQRLVICIYSIVVRRNFKLLEYAVEHANDKILLW